MPEARRAILLLLLCLGLAMPSGGAETFNLNGLVVPLQGFHTNGVFRMNPAGRKGDVKEEVLWEMQGRRATLQLPECHLTDFRMALQSPSRGNFTLESPHCTYDQQSHSLHSDAPMTIAGGGMKLEGVGYDVYMDETAKNIRVVVRQAVRMSVRLAEMPDAGRRNVRKVR